jgi:hypothetical protein
MVGLRIGLALVSLGRLDCCALLRTVDRTYKMVELAKRYSIIDIILKRLI